MLNHPLVATLKNLKGNPRAAVFTEPLWGIPFQLYAPYASVYMLALGIKDAQIGLLTSVGLMLQIVFALLSGAITDKLGRKRTTLIADLISWSLPVIIWAIAQNFTYFLIAAILNSVWRVSSTSWTCLLVEDAPQEEMVNIYAWIYISGLLVAFVAPLAGVLVNQFTLVPTVRGLYWFAFVMMTTKFLVMNHFVTETRQGQIRLEETRRQPFWSLMGGYREVFAQILKAPRTLATLGIMVVMSITNVVNGTFWGILITQKLHIPDQYIAIYPTLRSVVMLLFFFGVLPRISARPFRNPMLVGLSGFILSQLLLISIPGLNLGLVPTAALLGLVTLMEACSAAVVGPFTDSMLAVTVDAAERARILSILFVIVIVLSSPFGWIAGQLSEINRVLPFGMNMGLYIFGGVMVVLAARAARSHAEQAEPLSSPS